VLGFDQETLDQLSAQVNGGEWRGPSDTFEIIISSKRGFRFAESPRAEILGIVRTAAGFATAPGPAFRRHVICQGQLDSVVPLEPATMARPRGRAMDKEDCADMGIVKVDLLGLGMMAVWKSVSN